MFFEVGHGVGVPDGVGAAVNRAADARVLAEQDITNAKTMFEVLPGNTSHVKLRYVEASLVEENVKLLSTVKVSQKKLKA